MEQLAFIALHAFISSTMVLPKCTSLTWEWALARNTAVYSVPNCLALVLCTHV